MAMAVQSFFAGPWALWTGAAIVTLNRLNRDFYVRRAAAFSATRRRAWPGWRRVLAAYRR